MQLKEWRRSWPLRIAIYLLLLFLIWYCYEPTFRSFRYWGL